MIGRIFGVRPAGGPDAPRMQVRASESADAERSRPPSDPPARGDEGPRPRPPAYPVQAQPERGDLPRADAERVSRELGERVQSGFQDLSRLLGAIKETLQGRDGQVQQTLQALPDFLQQVPRIHRAEIECLAQISKQLEHMGSGTRDVIARLDGLPDLLRTLTVGQAQQAQFLEGLQARMAETLEVQSRALRQGLEESRKGAEAQLSVIRSLASTQEDIFATFQNTQNRALNVFHRAQQQTNAQHRETQSVMNRQIEMLVGKVHSAQTRVFWLSIGFAALAAAGMILALLL
jgi:ABC-type transporter Mla subunit MlaD